MACGAACRRMSSATAGCRVALGLTLQGCGGFAVLGLAVLQGGAAVRVWQIRADRGKQQCVRAPQQREGTMHHAATPLSEAECLDVG